MATSGSGNTAAPPVAEPPTTANAPPTGTPPDLPPVPGDASIEMVDAMRESMESLQHQLEAVQKQLAEQKVFNQNIIREWSNRLAMTEATLQQKFDKELKEEIKELKWKKKCSEGGFDERKLKLEPYDGNRDLWRDFAWTFLAFIAKESPVLGAVMEKAEGWKEEVKESHLEGLGVSVELDKQLSWLLVNNAKTGSEAKTLLRSIKSHTGLDMWRQLWKDAKPKSGAQESVDFQKLMKPDKARNYKDKKRIRDRRQARLCRPACGLWPSSG